MSTSNPLELIIYEWIRLTLEPLSIDRIIRSQQNGKTPDRPFVMFDIVTRENRHFSTEAKKAAVFPGDGGEGVEKTFVNRKPITVSVDAFADNGFEIHERLSLSTHIADVRRYLQESHDALNDVGTPRELTFLGDTEFEQRIQSDYVFLTWGVLIDIIERVLDIEVSGTTKFDQDPVV